MSLLRVSLEEDPELSESQVSIMKSEKSETMTESYIHRNLERLLNKIDKQQICVAPPSRSNPFQRRAVISDRLGGRIILTPLLC